MNHYSRSTDPSPESTRPDDTVTGLEEPLWQLGLGTTSDDSYPQRTDEADCTCYLRTGFCGFGSRCRFNHPRDRGAVIEAAARTVGDYPERAGQPVCQYYMRTRSCKFGASCKYHHPRQTGSTDASPVSLNYYGYPLRPGEKECSYFVKTGQCKFGSTCKFDHPVSAGVQVPTLSPVPPVSPLHVPVPSPLYPTVQPPSGPSSQQIGVLVARPPLLQGSLIQSPYGTVVLSPTIVPFSGWGPYQATATSPVLPSSTPANVGSAQLFGITEIPSSANAYAGPYQPSSSLVGPSSRSQMEQSFQARPNQPEYHYYSKTEEIPFAPSYRYHQPPDMSAPKVNVVLSPAGLPLRPGAALCTHYAQRGICKFGPACRFDHPIASLSYSPSASSLTDVPVAPYFVGSSVGPLAHSTSSSELQPELTTGSNKESIPSRISSSSSASTGSVGPVSQSGTWSSSTSAPANTTSSNVSHTSNKEM